MREIPRRNESALKRLSDEGLCTAVELDRTAKYAEKLRSERSKGVICNAARKFDAVGDPVRLMLVMLIRKKEMCVCELTSAARLTQPMASYQLGILENAGIVRRRKTGKWAFYSIGDTPFVDSVLKAIKPIPVRLSA